MIDMFCSEFRRMASDFLVLTQKFSPKTRLFTIQITISPPLCSCWMLLGKYIVLHNNFSTEVAWNYITCSVVTIWRSHSTHASARGSTLCGPVRLDRDACRFGFHHSADLVSVESDGTRERGVRVQSATHGRPTTISDGHLTNAPSLVSRVSRVRRPARQIRDHGSYRETLTCHASPLGHELSAASSCLAPKYSGVRSAAAAYVRTGQGSGAAIWWLVPVRLTLIDIVRIQL
jgi:hypothetical protein